MTAKELADLLMRHPDAQVWTQENSETGCCTHRIAIVRMGPDSDGEDVIYVVPVEFAEAITSLSGVDWHAPRQLLTPSVLPPEQQEEQR